MNSQGAKKKQNNPRLQCLFNDFTYESLSQQIKLKLKIKK